MFAINLGYVDLEIKKMKVDTEVESSKKLLDRSYLFYVEVTASIRKSRLYGGTKPSQLF